ncbi:Diacylglycerol kinase catalytic domain [Leishmania shawi]|uniref:diacylglycerol kinase (ATP) n=1 Tax=Leishmania shawi TaxID=5680 RepID=A0AAW3C007_9TRYP
MAHTIASCRGRATDVPTEDGVPSIPATPGQLAAKTARRFDGAASAPDLPAQSPEQLIDQYGRYYDSDVETSYHYMAAFINLDSGETGIGQAVLDSLRDVLGAKRVMVLCGEVFTNPASLRLLIKQQAVIYHSPGRSPRQRRGTVVAAGGDGTVSFLMTQLDLVRRELEAEFQPFLISSRQEVQLNSDNSVFSTSSVCDVTLHPYFTMPALAPLPLGTGNDYSNCVGFGCGFSPIAKGWCGLGALCKCSGDADAQVAVALSDAAKAPCVSFDRWEASLVPLRVAQAAVLSESSQAAAEAAQRGAPSALALHSPLWNRSARPRSVADAVRNVDWAKVHASGQCVTHGLINYLSVGFDAYVVKEFDSARRAHPAVCSTRAQNKAVYGVMGIRGALKCKKLCNIIPMVCVPRPKLSRVGGGAVATSRMSSTRDFVALQLPSMTKALVLTNVNCYSAGTHPWNPQSGELYYRPVTIRNGKVRPSVRTTTSGAAGATLPIPTPRPVTINDGAFELQAMGGVLHYTSLGIGLSNSTKLVQTDEMFVFVLCTPNDLHFPSGQCSTYTKLYMKDKYESRIESDGGVRASLNVQIDGEPMTRIAESTIIHVRRQPGARVLIRCRSPSVVQ